MNDCCTCKHGLKRCEFSYKKYGSYEYSIECCLIENEDMPWRKNNDNCEKYEERKDKK